MNMERVQRPPSYHHEELAYSDVVVFCVGSSSGVNVGFVCYYWLCLCVLCECPFNGASKLLSIDPLDLMDVFCRGASWLERATYSLYTLARSDHDAIR